MSTSTKTWDYQGEWLSNELRARADKYLEVWRERLGRAKQ